MNYFARGLPVLASVGEESEVARLVSSIDAGWAVGNVDMADFAPALASALADPTTLAARGAHALNFARKNLGENSLALRFEPILEELAGWPSEVRA
jgi:hypothetical protein